MLKLDKEGEEKKNPENRDVFSVSGCYDKDWVCQTNERQSLSRLTCFLCNQIANKGVELNCKEHEDSEHGYLVGEECLQRYLKQNKNKCPIGQHDHCDFSKSRTVRQQICDLFVMCARQYAQLREEMEPGEKESLPKNSISCHYKGKIQDMGGHLDKSCTLMSNKLSNSSEFQSQLLQMSEQIKQLQHHLQQNQHMVQQLQEPLQNKQSRVEEVAQMHLESKRQIESFKVEMLKRDEKMLELTKNVQTVLANMQQLQTEMKQHNVQLTQQTNQLTKCQAKIDTLVTDFVNHQRTVQTDLDGQKQQVAHLKLLINTQHDERKYAEKNLAKPDCNVTCYNMLAVIRSPCLINGVDFLLVNENKKTIGLKHQQWNIYNFGVYLLGNELTLCPDGKYNSTSPENIGHLCIKTSHLWIKHSSSKIDCTGRGYQRGPGASTDGCSSGAGYGTKGDAPSKNIKDYLGTSGQVYGEETLLKEIHYGSGSDKYCGGGIIELIIEQQLINHGSIQSNGNGAWSNGGGGSGGSILIELQCHSQSQPNTLEQTLGIITCTGGKIDKSYYEAGAGGDGRIAIYGIELSSEDLKHINPKPFNRMQR
ncbi:hypothetical protein RFI_27044 [Reticulomyxa filosa]|uniref:Uncharacterized protein n=1 Tax=Reticulomyxa filosa TaxID=46433 RepID=X6M8L7_RETFI|nr:hypothetical protein RFI_27044 [Reticulomyxa filosa]|eukprot:ETO10333.1 hypothetical protein RFI_27044 [Reticulomyxa filosa]